VIVLDTHIWVWWVHGDEHLNKQQTGWLQENEEHGLGVSIISCWEVAKLVEYNRLTLPCPVAEWLDQAYLFLN
jgi:PIN domain nuclease of toxin-antitoxin system